MSKYIVTITPPTPNGDLHLGHLSGPFLAADVCSRLLKQKGNEVLLFSYSDDYQSYMLRKARELNQDVNFLASHYADAISESLRGANIFLSHFLRAFGNNHFLNEVDNYFGLVEKAGFLERSVEGIPYCKECKTYGYEGFGRGICNHCGAESDASQCEACARVPEISLMGDIHCVLCKKVMTEMPISRLIWKIGQQYPSLRKYYETFNHRPELSNYLHTVLANENDIWAVTRPNEDGIPLKQRTEQTHTWFSGLAGYKATLREFLANNNKPNHFNDWWNSSTTLVSFLGFDCSYSHAVAYLSQLMIEKQKPDKWYHFTNQFLNLNGKGFSTSRNHAIFIREVIEKIPSDALRFYLALCSPENKEEDFKYENFIQWVDTFYNGHIASGGWKKIESQNAKTPNLSTIQNLRKIITEWEKFSSLTHFSIQNIAKILISTIDFIRTVPESEQGYLWLAYSHMGSSIHPEISSRIKDNLQVKLTDSTNWLNSLFNLREECYV